MSPAGPLRCPYCGFTCDTVATLSKHQACLQHDVRHRKDGEKTIAISPQSYVCEYCTYSNKHKLGLLNHCLRVHRIEVRVVVKRWLQYT